MSRPQCPDCGEDMIFLAIPLGGGAAINTWICDCRNFDWADLIEDARQDPEPDASITLMVIPYNNDAAGMMKLPGPPSPSLN